MSTCLNDSVVCKEVKAENLTTPESSRRNSEAVLKKNAAYVEEWDKNLKFLVGYFVTIDI